MKVKSKSKHCLKVIFYIRMNLGISRTSFSNTNNKEILKIINFWSSKHEDSPKLDISSKNSRHKTGNPDPQSYIWVNLGKILR